MNSSTAEQWFVRPTVESSNLSSSAFNQRSFSVVGNCECDEDGESWQTVNLLLQKLSWFESIHSHNGESPVGHGCCLENSLGVKASRVRISFSPLMMEVQQYKSSNLPLVDSKARKDD